MMSFSWKSFGVQQIHAELDLKLLSDAIINIEGREVLRHANIFARNDFRRRRRREDAKSRLSRKKFSDYKSLSFLSNAVVEDTSRKEDESRRDYGKVSLRLRRHTQLGEH
jgi:hypothetical protein